MNLYEINSQIKRILDNGFNADIDPETGEIIDEGEHDLETLEILRQDKLEGIALYIKNLTALADDIKAEEKSLAERRKAAEAKAERLSAYLADDLTSHGEKKLETAKCAVTMRKSEAVIVDESLLDMTWFKPTTTYKPMLAEIKKAIKSGETVDGAHIEERQKVTVK